MKQLVIAAAALLAVFASPANAAENQNYLGAGMGLSRIADAAGGNSAGIDLHVIAGHNFYKYVGVEAGFDLTNAGNSIMALPIHASLVGRLPITSSFGLFGKTGVAHSTVFTTTQGGGSNASGMTSISAVGVEFYNSVADTRISFNRFNLDGAVPGMTSESLNVTAISHF